jgi:hypothetical protein
MLQQCIMVMCGRVAEGTDVLADPACLQLLVRRITEHNHPPSAPGLRGQEAELAALLDGKHLLVHGADRKSITNAACAQLVGILGVCKLLAGSVSVECNWKHQEHQNWAPHSWMVRMPRDSRLPSAMLRLQHCTRCIDYAGRAMFIAGW